MDARTYQIKIKVPPMVKHEAVLDYKGKAQLVVSPEGVQIRDQNGSTIRHEIAWDMLRELKNNLTDSGTFRANFGGSEGELPLTVKLLEGDPAPLSQYLDSLPDATAIRCGHCAGPVEGKACRDCGKNFRAENRKSGLILLSIGLFATAIFTPLAKSALFSGNGGVGAVWIIAAGSALASALYGLYQIAFGTR